MKNKATVFVISAGILWGIISLFIKPLSSIGFSAIQISFLRSALSFILFFIYLLLTDRKKLKFKFSDIWMFIGTGIISLSLFNLCYFYAIINGQASIAVVLLYTSPVFIMLLSAILFKERITATKLLALVLTLGGCVAVSGVLGGNLNFGAAVIIAGVASGFFYGLYTIFSKYALAKYSSETVTVYTFLLSALSMLPFCNITKAADLIATKPTSILLIVAAAFFSTVLPYLLYTKSLTSLDSGKAAILVAIEPLVGAVVGTVFFREALGLAKAAGIIMVLSAIIILSCRNEKRSERYDGK